jgi:hypothetical protein
VLVPWHADGLALATPSRNELSGITGHHGPTVVSRAFTHDSRAALASLAALDTIDATLLLPGHGEPFAGKPADAAAQARSAGLR